jgi:hypothetical protein
MIPRTLLSRTLAGGLASLALALPSAAQSLAFTGPSFRFAAASSVVNGGLTVKATTPTGTPSAGAAVTFNAPAAGPSFVFSNGAPSITATTDTSGFAHADLVANASPGVGVVTASMASASDATTEVAIAGPVTLEANWLREADAGTVVNLGGTIHLPWLDCTYAARAAPQFIGTAATATLNGTPLPDVSILMPPSCPAGGGDARIIVFAQADDLVPDDYAVDLLVGLPYGMGFVEARAAVRIRAPLQATSASGSVLDFALYPPHGNFFDDCKTRQLASGSAGDAGWPASGPAGFDLPFGMLHLDATKCTAGNDLGLPHGPLALPAQVGVPVDLPDGAAVWAFGPTADAADPHWYSLGATSSGRFARWLITDGGAGDNSTTPDLALHSTFAVAIPRNGAAAGALQDLWWGGASESGWGLSLTQHGAKLFGGLFIYDAAGNPTWLVMPDGTWDAAGMAFQGPLYRPHGTRYDAYRAADLVVGAPVGTLRLSVSSLSSLSLDYVIDGVAGHKALQRQRFGPHDAVVNTLNLADLWWGGPEQNGWGFALAQQASTLFGVFFTYDSNGNPTWFVAPSATVAKPTSKVYRTHGSAWIGAAYNASALSVVEVGQVTYKMSGGSGPLEITIDGQPIFRNVTRQPF